MRSANHRQREPVSVLHVNAGPTICSPYAAPFEPQFFTSGHNAGFRSNKAVGQCGVADLLGNLFLANSPNLLL